MSAKVIKNFVTPCFAVCFPLLFRWGILFLARDFGRGYFPCHLYALQVSFTGTAYSARLSSGTEKSESRVVMKVASAMVVTSLW